MNNREEKWKKLLRGRKIFNWIPFVDFALVAGSMAMGEETENSDFDIILGCEKGRMFTARIFIIALFGLQRKRRKSTDGKEESKDKFCFSHFVTPDGYTLRPPYNIYWQTLYKNLIPIYGKEERVRKFFAANTWAGRGETMLDNRWLPKKPNTFRWMWEIISKTLLGDFAENVLKKYQLERIKKKKPEGKNPRVYVGDTELELHPDTSRIEEWISQN